MNPTYTGMRRIRRIVRLFGIFMEAVTNKASDPIRARIIVIGLRLVNAVAVVRQPPYNSYARDP
jgi:hypothetical protein